jgi:AAHS family 3-hydroxyphenylpropionic acid transporter
VGLEGYDIQAFGVAAPRMMRDLSLDASAQGIIGSAVMVGLILGAFSGGIFSRVVGLRALLAGATLLFGLCSIGTAFATSETALIVVRFLAGVGFGGALPVVLSIAAEISPPSRKTLTVTAAFCGLPAGAAAVAIYARSMGADVDWRMIFISGGLLPILLTPLIVWLIPNRSTVQEDASGSVLTDLLGNGRAASTLLIWLTFATTLFVTYLMLNWLPTLVVGMGLDAANGAMAAFLFNLFSIAGAVVIALLVDRLGFRWPLCLTYIGLAVIIGCLAAGKGAGAILFLSALAGFLVVGPQCALYALIPRIYPPHAKVLGAGAAVAMGRIGAIVGPLVAGEFRQAGYSASQVLLWLAPVPLLAAAAVFLLGSMASTRQAAKASALDESRAPSP